MLAFLLSSLLKSVSLNWLSTLWVRSSAYYELLYFVFIAIVCHEQYVLWYVKPNDGITFSLTFVIFIYSCWIASQSQRLIVIIIGISETAVVLAWTNAPLICYIQWNGFENRLFSEFENAIATILWNGNS